MSKRQISLILTYLVLIVAAVITVLPLIWMLSTSLKPTESVFTFPIEWFPREFHFENYPAALQARPFNRYMFNSLVVSVSSVIITVGLKFHCRLWVCPL